MTESQDKDLIELVAKVVCAFVARNPVPALDLPALVDSVYLGLTRLSSAGPSDPEPVEDFKPAVKIKKSIMDDYLICLEDGKKFKSLKRHLMSDYGLTPQTYRQKWGLPDNYPMVSPAYAKSRSALAKKMGFGRKNGASRSSDTPGPPSKGASGPRTFEPSP